MAVHGVSLSEREPVILNDDPGNPEHPDYKKAVEKGQTPETPTTFYIGNLSRADRIEIGDMRPTPSVQGNAMTMQNRQAQKAYETVARGLKGWDNMLTADGKPATFEETTEQRGGKFLPVVAESSMQILTYAMIEELSEKILEKNGLKEATVGNSAGASLQSIGLGSLIGDAPNAPQTSSESEDVPQPQFSHDKSQDS